MDELNTRLKKNRNLHIIIENEVRRTPFGTITFNIKLLNGVALIESLNIVKQRRRKYTLTNE